MNKLRDRGQEILGMVEGGFQSRRPGQRLARTIESICERIQDTSSSAEKFSIKVQYTLKPLESRFI